MTRREIKRELKKILLNADFYQSEPNEYEEEAISTNYIGSFMSLDPCGRYHNVLSINGLTSRCERFWDNLNSAADELGGWIQSGEGDPTDIYFALMTDVYEAKIKNHNKYYHSKFKGAKVKI